MIRVIIEREIAEGLEQYYEQAIENLLGELARCPGYVSGESLVDMQRPNHYLVITRWANLESWERWFRSPQRQATLAEIRPFLLDEEKFVMLQQLRYHRGS